MESGIAQPLHPRSREVHARLGRNLLLYQQIEQGLKLLVPYTHKHGSKRGRAALAKMRDDINSKSLGPVIQLFKESLAHEDPKSATLFESTLARVLEARNEMSHRFLLLPGVDLKSEEGCKIACSWLDSRFLDGIWLARVVTAHGLVLASAMGALTEDEVRQGIEALGGHLEVVEVPPEQ